MGEMGRWAKKNKYLHLERHVRSRIHFEHMPSDIRFEDLYRSHLWNKRERRTEREQRRENISETEREHLSNRRYATDPLPIHSDGDRKREHLTNTESPGCGKNGCVTYGKECVCVCVSESIDRTSLLNATPSNCGTMRPRLSHPSSPPTAALSHWLTDSASSKKDDSSSFSTTSRASSSDATRMCATLTRSWRTVAGVGEATSVPHIRASPTRAAGDHTAPCSSSREAGVSIARGIEFALPRL